MIEKEATTGERIADAVARFGGSWTFIITFGVMLTVYTVINVFLDKNAWDPYPFILLNLFLSMLASVQAPVIMMSQNRQDTRDRLRAELDFDVNIRAESEIQGLSRKLNSLDDKLNDVATLLRKHGLEDTFPRIATRWVVSPLTCSFYPTQQSQVLRRGLIAARVGMRPNSATPRPPASCAAQSHPI